MSKFTIITICFVVLAVISKYFVNLDDPILRNSKLYRIFVICSGLIALVLVSILGYNFFKFILSILGLIS